MIRISVLVAIILAGCGGDGGGTSSDATTVGYTTEPSAYDVPTFASGRIKAPGCGVTVVDEYQALTAWHCVDWVAESGAVLVVVPGYDYGVSATGAEPINVHQIDQIGEDKALLHLVDPAPAWVPECDREMERGDDVVCLGYPANFDNETQWKLTTTASSSRQIPSDWEGGSGSGCYLNYATPDQCLVAIISEGYVDDDLILVQQEYGK